MTGEMKTIREFVKKKEEEKKKPNEILRQNVKCRKIQCFTC